MNASKVKFRASKVGALMTGGNEITEKQLAQLDKLQTRKNIAKSGLAKPLTANMESTLLDLIAKRDAPFEFGETAKAFIEEVWLQLEYGYRDVLVTEQLLKGNFCEQDSIGLISKLCPVNEFRVKNKEHFENDWFTGTPDVILNTEDYVEDSKTSWNLKTYFQTRDIPELYYAQGQVYMDLTGKNNFRLHYCFVDTPEEILWQIKKKYFYKFGQEDEHPQYLEIVEQLDLNHDASRIPEEDRLKTFEFKKDEAYLKKLKERVGYAREYYSTLTLKKVQENAVARFKMAA